VLAIVFGVSVSTSFTALSVSKDTRNGLEHSTSKYIITDCQPDVYKISWMSLAAAADCFNI
jgi:hypothetical protein